MKNLAVLFIAILLFTSCTSHRKPDYKAIVGALGQNKVRFYVVSVRKMKVRRSFTLKGAASFVGSYPEKKEIYVLNPQANELIIQSRGKKDTFLPTGKLPLGLDVSPNGNFLVVANNEDHTVSVFQRQGRDFIETGRVKVGKFPVFVKFVSSSQCLVSNNGDSYLSLVDINRMKEIRQVKCGFSPFEIELDKDRNLIYTACFSENVVSLNSLTDYREIAKINVGEGPYGVAKSQNGELFVTNSNDGSISVVDVAQRKEIQKIAVGGYLAEMELTPDDNCLLILDRTDRKVICFSPQNLNKMWEMQLKGEPCALGITR